MKPSKAREQVRATAGDEERRVPAVAERDVRGAAATPTATRPQRVRSSFADVCTDMYAKARGDLIWD